MNEWMCFLEAEAIAVLTANAAIGAGLLGLLKDSAPLLSKYRSPLMAAVATLCLLFSAVKCVRSSIMSSMRGS